MFEQNIKGTTVISVISVTVTVTVKSCRSKLVSNYIFADRGPLNKSVIASPLLLVQ